MDPGSAPEYVVKSRQYYPPGGRQNPYQRRKSGFPDLGSEKKKAWPLLYFKPPRSR